VIARFALALVLALAVTLGSACDRASEPTADPIPKPMAKTTAKPTPTVSPGASWSDRFDFDGDGRADGIEVSFSGGAHCCYSLAVDLTRIARRIDLPFELDGGYVGGLSLDRPDDFDVRVGADGVAALFMHVATYAGSDQPIPAAWRRAYGIRTNRIVVDLRTGVVRATDA
jgi:hypothetical protein